MGTPKAQALPYSPVSILTFAFRLEAERPAWYLVLLANGEEQVTRGPLSSAGETTRGNVSS